MDVEDSGGDVVPEKEVVSNLDTNSDLAIPQTVGNQALDDRRNGRRHSRANEGNSLRDHRRDFAVGPSTEAQVLTRPTPGEHSSHSTNKGLFRPNIGQRSELNRQSRASDRGRHTGPVGFSDTAGTSVINHDGPPGVFSSTDAGREPTLRRLAHEVEPPPGGQDPTTQSMPNHGGMEMES